MHDIKTKFDSYVCFSDTPFDTTPDADTDDGVENVLTVTLDGEFTLSDLKNIKEGMEQYIEKRQVESTYAERFIIE